MSSKIIVVTGIGRLARFMVPPLAVRRVGAGDRLGSGLFGPENGFDGLQWLSTK